MSDTESRHHEPQDEAPGREESAPQSGDVLALSNISQEDIAPGDPNGAMVKALWENCNRLTNVMVDTHQKVDRMETVVDTLRRDVSDLRKQQVRNNSPYARFFECEEIKMMMSVLPLLCDGRYGVAGWIPVWYKGVLYIILSKSVTVSLMEVSVNTSGTTMAAVLQKHLKSAPINPTVFAELIVRTPFKPYKKNKNMSGTRWLNHNLTRYKVMLAPWFKNLIAEVHTRCDVPEELCADAVEFKIQPKHMYSDIGLSSQFDVGPVVYDSMGDGVELSRAKLVRMPAMKCCWWTEAYESGCKQYFGMTEVDGVMGVVTNGKYKEPFEDDEGFVVKSLSYDATLQALMISQPGLFSDEVKEMHPDLFHEQADVASRCKKRKNRRS